MIKAVLWDNDGVLLDTESLFFEATREAFAAAGLTLGKELWSKQFLGLGRMTKEIALSLGCDPAGIDALTRDRNNRYRTILRQPPQLLPQVSETLAALFGSVKMALDLLA